jgi:hypothetical protein
MPPGKILLFFSIRTPNMPASPEGIDERRIPGIYIIEEIKPLIWWEY